MNRHDPRKDGTRLATRRLIRAGAIVPTPCEECGAERVETHHTDDDDPTAVRFLCFPCHRAAHRKPARPEVRNIWIRNIDLRLWRQVRAEAHRRGVRMADVLEVACRRFLDDHDAGSVTGVGGGRV